MHRDSAKRGGGAAPGPLQRIRPGACLMQLRRWFHHLLPKYLITGDRKSPLESQDPPLEGSSGSDPSCS